MPIIKQLANFTYSVNKFDNGEQIDFHLNTEINVDEETADFLVNQKIFNEDGILMTDFVVVTPI